MKFHLHTLLLSFTVVALAIGWMNERRHYRIELEDKLYDARNFEPIVGQSTGDLWLVNRLKMLNQGQLTRKEFDNAVNTKILHDVVRLFISFESTNGGQIVGQGQSIDPDSLHSQFLFNAGACLDYLQLNDFSSTEMAVKNDEYISEMYESDLFLNDDHPKQPFILFIESAIANHQAYTGVSAE